MDLEARKYPIGKVKYHEVYTPELIKIMVADMAQLPANVRKVAEALTKKQRSLSYREGGWTASQIVHHIADSHANAYIRLKLTLTEDKPVIKAYDENRWAALLDGSIDNFDSSLKMLEAIHERWCRTWDSMTLDEYDRSYIHPQYQSEVPLKKMLSLYHWHGRHHLEHLRIISQEK
jgi:hypothetical protein